MAKPKTVTRTAPTFITACVNRWPSTVTTEPSPSMRGTVPKLNKSMERVPVKGLEEASAKICMDCSGPQGINPLSRPTANGRTVAAFFCPILLAMNFGICIFSRRSHGNIPNILIPMTIINVPAISFRIPCRSIGTSIPELPPMSHPISPSRKPTSV